MSGSKDHSGAARHPGAGRKQPSRTPIRKRQILAINFTTATDIGYHEFMATAATTNCKTSLFEVRITNSDKMSRRLPNFRLVPTYNNTNT